MHNYKKFLGLGILVLTFAFVMVARFPSKVFAIAPTANVTFELTTPTAGGGNTIAVDQTPGDCSGFDFGFGECPSGDKGVGVNVVNGTTSVVITATKTEAQTVVITGVDIGNRDDSRNVGVTGTSINPIYTVDTTTPGDDVHATGGNKTFLLTVSEPARANIVYYVNIQVATPVDITTVSVTGFMQPVITGTPQMLESLTPGDSSYYVSKLIWAPPDNNSPIIGSQVYVVTVTLTSNSGHEFPPGGILEGAGLSISGGGGTVTSNGTTTGAGSGNTLSFDVTFPETAVPTSLALTSPTGTGNSLTGGGAIRYVYVNVVNGTKSVIITGTMSGNQTAKISDYGDAEAVTLDTTSIPLAPTYTVDTTYGTDISTTGGSKTFEIIISDENFSDVTYTVTVTVAPPAPTLDGLIVTPSNSVIDLGFSPNIFSYNINVPNIVTSVTVTPTAGYEPGYTKTITVNDNVTTSDEASASIPLGIGPNIIPVVITTQKEEEDPTSTYLINITRLAPAVNPSGGGNSGGGCLLPRVWSMQTGSCQIPVVAPILSPMPTITTAPIVPLDVVRQGEGIETVLARQIIRNTQLATMYGYKAGTNLQSFAWSLADTLARDFGYVNSKGKEVRVSKPDVAAYELQLDGTKLTIYEYYDSKIVNIKSMSSILRNKYYYEYYFSKK